MFNELYGDVVSHAILMREYQIVNSQSILMKMMRVILL